MQAKDLTVSSTDVRKLLCAASGDAALLYLYLQSGNPAADAAQALNIRPSQVQCAIASLRQLGLWQEEKPRVVFSGERPQYTETDVLSAMDTDKPFRALYGEVQRLLGRTLNTEELKILLGFVRYLGMPSDVIVMLVCFCKERARQKGHARNPSLRALEKEAYAWAEQGIDTMEEAVAYIQSQNQRYSRIGQLMQTLQIRGRNLTPAEERYAQQWLDWGFENDVLAMAYERTCVNTGGLNWAYMNKILASWQRGGLMTAEQIRTGDRRPAASGRTSGRASGQLGDAEMAAIRKVLQEES